MPPTAQQRLLPACIAILVVLGLLLHLPWIAEPFGFFEINAGYFFGPFARSFENFGFAELRGVPLGTNEFLPISPDLGYPYFNHPPGTSWAIAAFGAAEWQMRLLPTVAAVSCGPLLLLFLWRPTTPWTAFAAGALFQVVAGTTIFGYVSYESLVMATGLLLWCAFQRRDVFVWRHLLWLSAVVGAWFDWAFGFFVFALLPLAVRQSGWRGGLRAVITPWLAAAASLGLIFVWLLWAKNAPFITAASSGGEAVGSMLERTLMNWPPLSQLLGQLSQMMIGCFAPPTPWLAALGTLVLVCRRDAVWLVCVLPGLCNIVLFAGHAATHTQFMCYLGIPICLGVACLIDLLSRLPRGPVLAALALLAVAIWPTYDTLSYRQAATDPMFARLGAAVSALATEPATPTGEPVLVTTNAPQNYPYYATSANVYMLALGAPEHLRVAMGLASHVRFVFLRIRTTSRDAPPVDNDSPALRKFLAPYPRRALDGLVGTYAIGPYSQAEITEAWAYDLWR